MNEKLLNRIDKLTDVKSTDKLRAKITKLKAFVANNKPHNNGQVKLSRKYLLRELQQIEKAYTIERARYYLRRLKKSLSKVKTSSLNDINLNRWKDYEHILTDSLWMLGKRDTTGAHAAWYWGNFIPQIPRQLMLRYTKKGEWVIDTFAGSGTTLLESPHLKRNCIGVELQPAVAKKTNSILKNGSQEFVSALEVGDSATVDLKSLLKKYGGRSAQLVIMHPPYHDIIKFSKKRDDLSNAKSTEAFIEMFGKVVENASKALDKKRYLAVVIGDKYENGEWVPLGFMTMNEVLKKGFKLKSIVVKNFEQTLGKRNQKELWRYRALAGGFYVFKHEYIFIFQKR
ncbi:MAG: DNA methyltransferase [Ignavibacteriales bacterium]|nr:DNA methyltransferase [Ignavibacteriales bacterium]